MNETLADMLNNEIEDCKWTYENCLCNLFRLAYRIIDRNIILLKNGENPIPVIVQLIRRNELAEDSLVADFIDEYSGYERFCMRLSMDMNSFLPTVKEQ